MMPPVSSNRMKKLVADAEGDLFAAEGWDRTGGNLNVTLFP